MNLFSNHQVKLLQVAALLTILLLVFQDKEKLCIREVKIVKLSLLSAVSELSALSVMSVQSCKNVPIVPTNFLAMHAKNCNTISILLIVLAPITGLISLKAIHNGLLELQTVQLAIIAFLALHCC